MSGTAKNGADERAQALVASYMRAGYARIEPPLLQPAEPFLDLSGEDIRRRMFLTSDPDGRELCLRPDLTIPVSRDYLQSDAAGKAAGFCYLGAVFRHREGAPRNSCKPASSPSAAPTKRRPMPKCSRSVSRPPRNMASARRKSASAMSACSGLSSPRSISRRSGSAADQGFQSQSLAGARSRSAHARGRERPKEYQGVLAALAGSDPKAAHHLVTDLLSIAGIAAVGGRSVAEIADRFLEQAALNAPTRLPRETRALIERFLSVAGDPDDAASELRALAADAKISLGPALDLFETRTGFLAPAASTCAPSNSRPRSGAASTITPASCSSCTTRGPKPLVAGGRYDGLLTRLGARAPIPAVGFAASIDELAACGGPS
jgi:ATP phosphoribosyltransferase regulatory subunit